MNDGTLSEDAEREAQIQALDARRKILLSGLSEAERNLLGEFYLPDYASRLKAGSPEVQEADRVERELINLQCEDIFPNV